MLAKIMKDELAKRNLSARAASQQIGVSHTTIVRSLNGESVDVDTLIKIANWLGVAPSSLLDVTNGGTMADQLEVALSSHPQLAKVLADVLAKYVGGELPAEDVEDIIRYAAYRLS